MYNKIVKDIEIFDDCSEIEISFVVNNLKTLLFLPKDEIIRQGDFGNRMYFIGSGVVEVFINVEKVKKKDEEVVEIDGLEIKGPQEQTTITDVRIARLREGQYFGEIALITNLKRTATVRAQDYTTLAFLSSEDFNEVRQEFPQVYLNFKKKIRTYEDQDFAFRRQMVKNVPYFKNLDEEIIEEIVYLLKPHRYDFLTTIIKFGDITNQIHFLKSGEIEVTIPQKKGGSSETLFEVLNPGSCFCAFSAFSDDIQQLVNFKARTNCVVETISVQDLEVLERTYL